VSPPPRGVRRLARLQPGFWLGGAGVVGEAGVGSGAGRWRRATSIGTDATLGAERGVGVAVGAGVGGSTGSESGEGNAARQYLTEKGREAARCHLKGAA
jgi:hypothetical protein